MANPIGTLLPYANIDDMIANHDVREILETLIDINQRATIAAVRTVGSDENKVLTAALLWATGKVESACIVSKRYTPDQLKQLTGGSRQLLLGVVCDLAMYKLKHRRNPKLVPGDLSYSKDAIETLEALQDGEEIFAFDETINATGLHGNDGRLSLLQRLNANRWTTESSRMHAAPPYDPLRGY